MRFALSLAAVLFLVPCGAGLAAQQREAQDGEAQGREAREKPESAPAAAERDRGFSLAGVGFATPESALHDPCADVYLVSNIDGQAAARDGNGFISRVTPEGRVEALRWIDGGKEGATLNAPKGMALAGDLLCVADIDTLRFFDRLKGAPRGAVRIEGAVFLNDVAAGGDGRFYVTDTGAGKVFRVDAERRVETLAGGKELARPNGIVAAGGAVWIAGFGGDRIYRLDTKGRPAEPLRVPAGGLDGLVRLADGSFLVSSWEGGAVFRVGPGRKARTVVRGVRAPADIGFDARRGRLLIPLFQDDRLEVRPLEGAGADGARPGGDAGGRPAAQPSGAGSSRN